MAKELRRGIAEKRLAAASAIRKFADRNLRGPMGWGEAELEVEPPVGGRQSLLCRVAPKEAGEGSAAAVFAFARRDEHKAALRAARLAMMTLGIFPRLLDEGGGWFERLRYGYNFLGTEWTPGTQLGSTLSSPQAEALAAQLARLHESHSRAGERATFNKVLSDRTRYFIKHLRKNVPDADADAIQSWVLERIEAMAGTAPLVLTHGGLAPDDILWDEATGRLTLIDLEELDWGRPGLDLAPIRQQFFSGDDPGWFAFMERYFAAAIEAGRESVAGDTPDLAQEDYDELWAENREEIIQEAPLFDALYALRRTRSRNIESRAEAVRRLGEIMKEHPSTKNTKARE